VATKYQKQGIGKMLLDVTIETAKMLSFKKVYLFTFDPKIPEHYQRFGWKKIGTDELKSPPVILMELCL
jgi:N-acetylglutamate synthase-like GNAT family acetyltransferase